MLVNLVLAGPPAKSAPMLKSRPRSRKAQLSIEDVMAETLESKIDSFERFDRMLASSEARRNNALPRD